MVDEQGSIENREKENRRLTKEEETVLGERLEAEYSSPSFKHGVDIGQSMGKTHSEDEAIRAYDAGEIDLWISYVRPKTREEWNTFKKEHEGDNIPDRWKPVVTMNTEDAEDTMNTEDTLG